MSAVAVAAARVRPDPLPRGLRLRIAVGFVNRLVDAMVTAFVAVYLAAAHGPARAGLLMAAVVALGVAGMLVGGHLCERWGRRPTLLAAESAGAAAFAAMALAAGRWAAPVAVYVAYLVAKLAASVALPAHDAVVVDLSTPDTRRRVYAIAFWATNLALAVGALLGAAFYDGHFAAVIAGAAGCCALVAVSTALFVAESRPAGVAVSGPGWRAFVTGYRPVVADRRFGRLVLAGTLLLAVEFQLVNHIAVRLSTELPAQRLLAVGGWSFDVDGVAMVGLLRAENTVLVVAAALAAAALLRRVPDGVALAVGTALFTGGYMVLAVSRSGWLLLAAGLVLTVGELITVPVRQALLADLVPEAGRSRYLAVNNLTIRAAQLLAALCITVGSLVPAAVMAALYGAAGLVAAAQFRAVLAHRQHTRPDTK